MYEEEDADAETASTMDQQRLSGGTGTDSSGTLAEPSQSPTSGHDDQPNLELE
jgi:hypothetical protein